MKNRNCRIIVILVLIVACLLCPIFATKLATLTGWTESHIMGGDVIAIIVLLMWMVFEKANEESERDDYL